MSTNPLIPPQPATNPLLDEIKSHVARMSPGAQAAVHSVIPAQSGASPPSLIQHPDAHAAVPPIGGNPDPGGFLRPGGSNPPAPMLPPSSAHVNGPPALGSIPGQENESARLIGSGSGISQIKNPFGRTAATIGNTIGGIIAPGLMSRFPGTEEHHERLISQDAGATKLLQGQRTADTANAEGEAKTGLTQAQIPETQARTQLTQEQATALPGEQAEKQKLEDAQITNLLHPQAKTDFEAWRQQNPNAPVQEWLQAMQQAKAQHPEKPDTPEQQYIDEFQRLHPGATVGQAEHQYASDTQRPQRISVNTGNAELDRISGRLAKPYQTAYDAGNKTLERMELTRRNVDAGYAGQGLAIPELLTSLVSGQGTGVRITQPELNAITAHRGIKGSAESFFNSLAGKGALTAEDKTQIKGVLQDAETRLQQKMKIHSDALDAINGAGSREDAVRADRTARQSLNQLGQSGDSGGAPQGAVATGKGSDGKTYWLDKDNKPLGEKK